ncbi:MAG: adenylyltransferase/cytidyltransferase family protein [Minisyncoccia bacterium]
MNTDPVVVAVSGGFDPVHVGHIRYFKQARELGDKLIVILNDDEWLMRKKGYVFMPQEERIEVLQSIRYIDEIIVRDPAPDMSIIHMLEKLPIHIFAKGGDRTLANIPEADICNARGIKMIFGVGGSDKPQSSSWLAENVAKQIHDSGKLEKPEEKI